MNRLSGSSATMMFSSTVCRFSGRECWNTMPKPLRAILCAGRPATFSPWNITSPAVGRSMPMIALHRGRLAGAVRADQAEDFAGAQIEAQVLDRGQAAEALGQAADFENGRVAGGRIHHERASRDRAAPRKPPGKNRTTSSATAETMKVASSPGRPQEFAGDDQEDRAERGAQHGAAAAEHGGDDDVDADGDVDHGADRGGAEIEHQQRARRARRRTR